MLDPNNSAPPVAPTAPAPTVTPHVEPHTKAGVSDREAATIAGWIKQDLASGKMTQVQADQVFNELNTPLAERSIDDLRSEEVKLLDIHYPVATPDQFTIEYAEPGQELKMTPELKQADTYSRNCLTAAGFERGHGNSFVHAVKQAGNIIKDMSPDQRIAWGEAEYSKLERCYGQDLPERLNAAGQMVRQIELEQGPGLVNILKQVGDHAMVAKMLIDQAPRFWARRKGR